MGRGKPCFVVVIFSKIDWNPGNEFDKLPKVLIHKPRPAGVFGDS